MPKTQVRRVNSTRQVNPTRKIKVKEGALHQQLGIPKDEGIPTTKLEELKKSKNPKTKKRAVFALNARNWQRPAFKRKTNGHRGMSKTERSVWNSLRK